MTELPTPISQGEERGIRIIPKDEIIALYGDEHWYAQEKAVHDAAIYDIRVLPENEPDQSGLY